MQPSVSARWQKFDHPPRRCGQRLRTQGAGTCNGGGGRPLPAAELGGEEAHEGVGLEWGGAGFGGVGFGGAAFGGAAVGSAAQGAGAGGGAAAVGSATALSRGSGAPRVKRRASV